MPLRRHRHSLPPRGVKERKTQQQQQSRPTRTMTANAHHRRLLRLRFRRRCFAKTRQEMHSHSLLLHRHKNQCQTPRRRMCTREKKTRWQFQHRCTLLRQQQMQPPAECSASPPARRWQFERAEGSRGGDGAADYRPPTLRAVARDPLRTQPATRGSRSAGRRGRARSAGASPLWSQHHRCFGYRLLRRSSESTLG